MPYSPYYNKPFERPVYITARKLPDGYIGMDEDIPKYEQFIGKIETIEQHGSPFIPRQFAYHYGDRTPRLVKDIWLDPDKNCFFIEVDEKGDPHELQG